MTRLFCFGLGYSALALARDLMAEGWSVAGTTRSEEKHRALEAEGIEAFSVRPGPAAARSDLGARRHHPCAHLNRA